MTIQSDVFSGINWLSKLHIYSGLSDVQSWII